MKKITKKIRNRYLHHYNNCPFCNSADISGDNFEVGDNQAWREVSCDDCDESWTEIFTLTDIEKKQ